MDNLKNEKRQKFIMYFEPSPLVGFQAFNSLYKQPKVKNNPLHKNIHNNKFGLEHTIKTSHNTLQKTDKY